METTEAAARTESIHGYLDEYRKCGNDPWYFATHYLYTLDPNATDVRLRVRLFPDYAYIREDIFEPFLLGQDMHVNKSRQMVVTTSFCALFLWCLLYQPGFSALLSSRKEPLVDDGGSRSTWNSLAGKVRFMHMHLPPFLRQTVDFSYLRITNPANGSVLSGESGNVEDAGRASTYTVGFMDEAARLPRSESLFSSLRSCCRQLVINSTPKGKQGIFWRLHKAPDSHFKRIRIGWRKHPERSDAWYANATKDMLPEQIASELEMSFEGSVSGRCIPEFDYDKHVVEIPLYSDNRPLVAGWDFGIGDPTAVVFLQRTGDTWDVPGSMQRNGLITADIAPLVEATANQFGFTGNRGDIQCYGDATGGRRSPQTGRSDIADYALHGWHIVPVSCGEPDRFRLWRRLLKAGHCRIHASNAHLIDGMEQLHYPVDQQGAVLSVAHSDMACHEHSHSIDAGGYPLTRLERVGGPVRMGRLVGV